MANSTFVTPLTELFGIRHPVMLAGMDTAAGPELAAAVTNAGGIGIIGGVLLSPSLLRSFIRTLKSHLHDPRAPWGVDLLVPQVGGNARKTNEDYTRGELAKLVDVIINEGARLFVCAVGIPPRWVVDRFHEAGIPVMNMVGHPKHVPKALAQGVDMICAQGGEAGGHTGDIPFSILIPSVVDLCSKARTLKGDPVLVVAAGGIADGRGLAAALVYGASGVWVGTRFLASTEAGAPQMHKDLVLSAGYDDIGPTLIYSGRPMRVRRTNYVKQWETTRRHEQEALLAQGKIPYKVDLEEHPEKVVESARWVMGKVAGSIHDIKPAKDIVEEIVRTAAERLERSAGRVRTKL